MATLVEFTIPADDFPLGHVFESFPNVTIEIEQVIPTNSAILPYFWVRGEPVEHVQDKFEAQRSLKSYSVIDDLGDQGLFRAEWDSDAEGVLTGLIEAELTLLSASGTEDVWTFQLRAQDTDQITTFQQYCADHDIPIELRYLHSVTARTDEGQYGLTPEQQEAVSLAYKNGYYETPPETNLGELATKLGIAHQSFSDRLRRGINNLIGETLE